MADNDSYEKDVEEIFGETRGERERKRLKQISDAAAESIRLANDFKQELKKEEIQSDDPMIQKCLDIIRDKKSWVEDLCENGIYTVYIGNKKYFQIHRYYNGDTKYNVEINHQTFKFYGERPDLEELCRMCMSKHASKSQERQQGALDFLRIKERGKKHLTPEQKAGNMFTLWGSIIIAIGWGSIIIAIGRISYVENKKTQRVNKQVEAFEKTLPADYLEQKQAVEHYRDSLMHAKRR